MYNTTIRSRQDQRNLEEEIERLKEMILDRERENLELMKERDDAISERDNQNGRNHENEEIDRLKWMILERESENLELMEELQKRASKLNHDEMEIERLKGMILERESELISNRELAESKESGTAEVMKSYYNKIVARNEEINKLKKKQRDTVEVMKNYHYEIVARNEEINELKKKQREGDMFKSNPVPFSFFEDKETLTEISDIELLKVIMKKNEMDIRNTQARVIDANERIRDRISELKMEVTLMEKEKIIKEAARKQEEMIKKQMEEKMEQSTCNICFEREKDVTLVPCGHCLCKICVDKLRQRICPICRERIKGTQKFYL